MSEQTVVAESSSAPAVEVSTPVMDVSRGPLVDITPEQRAEFRKTGNLPEPPKKEEAAPSPEAKQAETSTASEADKKQETKPAKVEKPKQTAEERIAQLESTIEKIRKGAGIEKTAEQPKPMPKPEPQYTRPKPTAEDKDKDGNLKYQTYEDFVEELADWKAEQRWAASERERTAKTQAAEFQAKVDEAKSRYGTKFDEILSPTVNTIVSDPSVSPAVKAMLNDSEILPDLIFTLGSDSKELETFLDMAKRNPGKAIRYIALTESLIRQELEAKPETPAKPQTSAPKPPSEVGGRATTPNDQLESAAKANDFRAFKAEANRRALAKLKT